MAYFYTSNCSNYPQIYDNNYQYYHHQYNNNNNYDSSNHDYSRYVHYNYNETQFHGNNAYYYQQSPNPSLVGYYYSNYYQPESKNNAYFHENGGDYYYDDVVSTQYIVSYDTTNGEAKKVENEVFFEEYNPEPFHGGYDINVTYGKPLPPSDDICYPLSKNEVVVNNPNVPSLDDNNKRIVESEQINDDDDVDDDEFDEDDDDDDDYDDDDDDDGGGEGGEEEKDDLGKETMMVVPIASLGDALDKKVDVGEKKDDFDKEKKKSVSFEDEIHEKDNNNKNQNVGEVIQVETPSKIEAEKEQEQEQEQGKKEEMNGSHDEIRRQIPAGYGMESLDLCEGLFGGYFPCLWKRKQRNNNNNNIEENSSSYNYYEAKLSEYDYDYCCKDTVDYLFGNPNPYGGSMPEKGSYGDPVYSYHRHYPQQPVTEQVDCYGGSSSWLQSSSRYYYGHNNGDYYQ